MKFPQTILFDLDDTILSHTAGQRLLVAELCAKYAVNLDTTPEELRAALAKASAHFWGDAERHRRGRLDLGWAKREIARAACESLGRSPCDLTMKLGDEYYERRSEHTRPFDGSVETLRTLKQRGVRLGLLTNGAADVQKAKIERFDLTPLFDAIWIEGERQVGKPQPDAYFGLLRELDSDPATAWMVGDHLEWEVAASKALGLFSIWVDHERRGLPEGCPVTPDRVVHAIAELVED